MKVYLISIIKGILKNPITVWLNWLANKIVIEFKWRHNNLHIGYLARVKNCKFGNFNTIYQNAYLENVKLGDLSYISKGASIFNTYMGKYCSVGPDVKCGLGKHPTHTFVSTHPVFFSTIKLSQLSFVNKNCFEEFENIEIGNDVWIGANAIILDGVKIGDGAIIAAGAVVVKDVPPYAIMGGVPAKILKYRFDNDKIELLKNLKWWDKDIESLKDNVDLMHNINDFLKKYNDNHNNNF